MKRIILATLAGLFMLVWVPTVIWAHGNDLTKRDTPLGMATVLAPLFAMFTFAAVYYNNEDKKP